MKKPKPLGCAACHAIGLWHCSDPIRCGGMQYEWVEESEKREIRNEGLSNDNGTDNNL